MSDQPNVIDLTEENRPYFNALFMLAAGIRNPDAEDTLVGCIQEMLRLRAQVARQAQQLAEARDVAKRVVALDYISYVPTTATFYECPWCGISYDLEQDMRAILLGTQQFSHMDRCVITLFRALLATLADGQTAAEGVER